MGIFLTKYPKSDIFLVVSQRVYLNFASDVIIKQLIDGGCSEIQARNLVALFSAAIRRFRSGETPEEVVKYLVRKDVPKRDAGTVVDYLVKNPAFCKVMRCTYGTEHINLMDWCENTKLLIGSFCSIGYDLTVYLGGNHRLDWVTTFPFGHKPNRFASYHGKGHPASNGNVTIGNDVWLGTNCTIMSGVTIGDGAVVAANSHVVRDVGPYEIVGGNPARFIRHRVTDTQRAALLELKWWDLPDERLDPLIPFLCSDDIDLAIQKIREVRAGAGMSA